MQSLSPAPVPAGRPFVRLKLAASLDGITALPNGQSQWITSPQAREDGHRWRARADSVLTGIGTVLADDPRLDVRLPAGELPSGHAQPAVIVADSLLRTPDDAALFAAQRPVHMLCTTAAPEARAVALRARGAVVHRIAAPGSVSGTANGSDRTMLDTRLDLVAALALLRAQDIASVVHVEAGAQLAGALLRAGLVDELLLYLAPTLLGSGRGLADIGPLASLAQGTALEWTSVDRVGPDLRIVARVRPAAP